MNTSKINIISVLKIIYILLALLLIAQILKNLNLSVDFLLMGFSALCYLVSHIIRAIRLRFVISSNEFNTQKALFVQLGAASLGNLLFPLAKDLLAAVLIFL